MHIVSFLKFYTAFAEDKSLVQQAGEVGAEVSRSDPSIGTCSTAPHVDKFGQDADAHSH